MSAVINPVAGAHPFQPNFIGRMTWAVRPSATANAGRTIFVTDVGIGGGSYWFSNGTEWRPFGAVVLARGAGTTMANPGHTIETELGSATVPAGAMGATGILIVRTLWKTTTSINIKSLRVKLGGYGFFAYNATTTVSAYITASINNLTASTQASFASNSPAQSGVWTAANVSGAVDTASAQSVSITGQLALGTEECSLVHYSVEVE